MLYALDRNDGTPVWMYDVTADGTLEFHGDPRVAGELVYVGTDGKAGYVYAFGRTTGKVHWKLPADEGLDERLGFTTDIIKRGGVLYTVAIGDYVVAIDLRDGSRKWRFRSSARPDRLRFSNGIAVVADRVFFGGLDGILYALDAKTGKPVWKRDLKSAVSTAVVAHDRELLFGTADKRLHRLRQWTVPSSPFSRFRSRLPSHQ